MAGRSEASAPHVVRQLGPRELSRPASVLDADSPANDAAFALVAAGRPMSAVPRPSCRSRYRTPSAEIQTSVGRKADGLSRPQTSPNSGSSKIVDLVDQTTDRCRIEECRAQLPFIATR